MFEEPRKIKFSKDYQDIVKSIPSDQDGETDEEIVNEAIKINNMV